MESNNENSGRTDETLSKGPGIFPATTDSVWDLLQRFGKIENPTSARWHLQSFFDGTTVRSSLLP